MRTTTFRNIFTIEEDMSEVGYLFDEEALGMLFMVLNNISSDKTEFETLEEAKRIIDGYRSGIANMMAAFRKEYQDYSRFWDSREPLEDKQ